MTMMKRPETTENHFKYWEMGIVKKEVVANYGKLVGLIDRSPDYADEEYDRKRDIDITQSPEDPELRFWV